MTKRLLAILMAVIMCSGALASCSQQGSDESSSDTTAASSDTAESVSDDTSTGRIEPDLPERDFEGYEFKIVSKGKTMPHWQSKDLTAEELTGEPINDAVYERNSKICEKYNFKIVEIPVADYYGTAPEVSKSINAGTDDYDMLCLRSQDVISSFITNGYLLDLRTIPYMDLTKPWYDQNAISQLSVDNKVFLATGDMLTMDNDAIGAVFFNKGIVSDFGIENLYDAVNNGTWTIDKMLELAIKVSHDANGDGKLDEKNDVWGVESENCLTSCLVSASGATLISKDKDDRPIVTADSDKYVAMLEKVLKIQCNRDITLYAEAISGYSDVWTECLDVVFMENRALFNAAWLNRAQLFREMETDFGILPYPKYDEAQDGYNCPVSMYCMNSITIPKTATNTERTGIIIEALSAESKYTLLPAYYDKTLKSKASRDEESSAMLDIIFASTIYDLGYMYNWGNINTIVNTLGSVAGGDISGYASKLSGSMKVINKNIEKFVEKIVMN